MAARLRRAYGDSPLHLLAAIVSFAVAGYAFFRVFEAPSALGTVLWFAGAALAHDLIAFPLYSGLNLVASRSLGGGGERGAGRRLPALNYLRVPAVLSGLALLLFFPLILGLSAERFEQNSGLDAGIFLGRWLGLCAVLFLGSALLYAIRLRRAARRDSAAAESEQGEPG